MALPPAPSSVSDDAGAPRFGTYQGALPAVDLGRLTGQWNPGLGRTPAPGTQAQLGDLIQAWIDTGAKCPAPGGVKVPSHDLKADTATMKPAV